MIWETLLSGYFFIHLFADKFYSSYLGKCLSAFPCFLLFCDVCIFVFIVVPK